MYDKEGCIPLTTVVDIERDELMTTEGSQKNSNEIDNHLFAQLDKQLDAQIES